MQRHLRLRQNEDFDRLRKTGQVWRHPFMILSVASNDLAHNRYGFITGKRLGNAVVRNRVRRLLREVVRDAHPHLVPGYDLAFIAREAIVGQHYQTVYNAVVSSLQRSGLWESREELT